MKKYNEKEDREPELNINFPMRPRRDRACERLMRQTPRCPYLHKTQADAMKLRVPQFACIPKPIYDTFKCRVSVGVCISEPSICTILDHSIIDFCEKKYALKTRSQMKIQQQKQEEKAPKNNFLEKLKKFIPFWKSKNKDKTNKLPAKAEESQKLKVFPNKKETQIDKAEHKSQKKDGAKNTSFLEVMEAFEPPKPGFLEKLKSIIPFWGSRKDKTLGKGSSQSFKVNFDKLNFPRFFKKKEKSHSFKFRTLRRRKYRTNLQPKLNGKLALYRLLKSKQFRHEPVKRTCKKSEDKVCEVIVDKKSDSEKEKKEKKQNSNTKYKPTKKVFLEKLKSIIPFWGSRKDKTLDKGSSQSFKVFPDKKSSLKQIGKPLPVVEEIKENVSFLEVMEATCNEPEGDQVEVKDTSFTEVMEATCSEPERDQSKEVEVVDKISFIEVMEATCSEPEGDEWVYGKLTMKSKVDFEKREETTPKPEKITPKPEKIPPKSPKSDKSESTPKVRRSKSKSDKARKPKKSKAKSRRAARKRKETDSQNQYLNELLRQVPSSDVMLPDKKSLKKKKSSKAVM